MARTANGTSLDKREAAYLRNESQAAKKRKAIQARKGTTSKPKPKKQDKANANFDLTSLGILIFRMNESSSLGVLGFARYWVFVCVLMCSCQASRSTTYGVGKARVNHSGKSHSVKLIPPKLKAGPVQSGTYVCKIERVGLTRRFALPLRSCVQ